jgi:hypothetical protein
MSNPFSLNEMLGMYKQQHNLPDDVEPYPSHLGVFCDECEIVVEGDFIVHEGMTKAERLGVVRTYAVGTFGWLCQDGEDLCANCRDEADPMILHAPWTAEQVKLLNIHQGNVKFHPFTCGRDHDGHRILTATEEGWACPETDCDYTQRWALRAMTRVIHLKGCPDHGFDCEPDDHIEPPTVGGEVL